MAQALSTPGLTTMGRDDARETADANAARPRQIYNPIQKDTATFLKTAEETNGAYSLLEIEIAPGGGNGLHYHKTYAEHFTVISGEFGVQVGEAAVAPAGMLHRWFNSSQQPATVRVELRPGHTGFERALQIVYGLACDGLATKDGRPKSLAHMALVVEMSDTNVPGVFSAIAPLLRIIAKSARRRGIERELIDRYCR